MFNTNLLVKHITVPMAGLPEPLAGLSLAHVSDLHFREWCNLHEQAQEALQEAIPDLVLLTGDYGVNPRRWRVPADLLRRFLEPVADHMQIYGVLGNHDHPDMIADSSIPAVFLRNESITLEHNGVPFEVTGIDQHFFGGEDLDAALGDARARELTILLAHYPSTIFRLPPGRVDLQLSGHTHGGQIRIPLLGCVWPNDRISGRMARGLHAVGGTMLHVTPGIGVSTPIRARINCPPEISLLTLQSAIGENRLISAPGLVEVNADPAPIP